MCPSISPSGRSINNFFEIMKIIKKGKRDFAEENNLTHFHISYSEKKKSLLGSAGWKKLAEMTTDYKWDAAKGISYHKFPQ